MLALALVFGGTLDAPFRPIDPKRLECFVF
jgi:hypothetical protein